MLAHRIAGVARVCCLMAAVFALLGCSVIVVATESPCSYTNDIMVTGYWDPTGKMLRHYSTNKWLNPGGWLGGDYNGSGYDVYSFFPAPGSYNGTLEVDYQDTSTDFWAIADSLHPVAIVGFGAGDGPWEIEYNARNLNSWVGDSTPPTQPTPCPPDSSKPPDYTRHSTLPVEEIAYAVNKSGTVEARVDYPGDPGSFLCEFMAYHGMWYQDIHNSTSDPYHCAAAGFIHVKDTIPLQTCMLAVNVTLDAVIQYLQTAAPVPEPIAVLVMGFGAVAIVAPLAARRGSKKT